MGNHYFAPDCDVKIIENYLDFLEKKLNKHHHRVFMLGDFNAPKYDWLNGTPLSNCYYYNKIKGNFIYVTSCFLGLNQHNNSISNSALLDQHNNSISNSALLDQHNNSISNSALLDQHNNSISNSALLNQHNNSISNSALLDQHNNSISNSALLDLVFTNINDLFVSIQNYPIAAPDNYNPILNFDFKLTFDSQSTFLTPQRNYGEGDYLLLQNTLSNYDRSCVFNENSVDSAVYNFTASVSEALLTKPFLL
jgi:hypothetical protein